MNLKLKKIKKSGILLIFLFLLGVLSIPNINTEEKQFITSPINAGIDDIGINFDEVDCYTIFEEYLYFVNSNGFLYEVNLQFINEPLVVLLYSGLEDVRDIAAFIDESGYREFYFTTINSITHLTMSPLNYETIYLTLATPRYISVYYAYYVVGDSVVVRMYGVWIDWSDRVYYFMEGDLVPTEITPDNFDTDYTSYHPKTIQVGDSHILLFNSTNFFLYEVRFYTSPVIQKYAISGLRKAYLDESRGSIIYAIDPSNDDGIYDGQIFRYNYDTGITTLIKDGCKYPVDIYTTPNFIYWLEQGYWSDQGAIYRNSYFLTNDYPNGFFSVVSKTEQFPYRFIVYNDDWSTGAGKSVYWSAHYGVFITTSFDQDAPYWENQDWISSSGNTFDDDWVIYWKAPVDLNEITGYQLLVSNDPSFNEFQSYYTDETEYTFLNNNYGSYYYKLVVNDSNFQRLANEVESNILNINYLEPDDPEPLPSTPTIPGYSFIIFVILLGIGMIIRKKKLILI